MSLGASTSLEINSQAKNQTERFLFWYSFFMAFTVIVPVFNISIYIFPLLLISFKRRYGYIFRWRGYAPLVILMLSLGILSNIYSVTLNDDSDYLRRTLQVVPNYFYWLLLIWFLYSQRDNLNFLIISRAIFWGVITLTIFYFFIAPLRLSAFIPFIGNPSQNSFALLIIMFTPVAVRYSIERYGERYAWLFLIIMIVSGFLSGSRSSSILVLFGGLLSMYLDSFHRKTMIRFGLVGIILYIVLQMSFFEEIIHSLNPRTHDLLYNTSATLKTDRSYLIRKVQIEKGLSIFNQKPFAGIGLNNFTSFSDVALPGDFEGAKYVMNKPGITEMNSHNSYINLLAEGGLAFVVPFGLLILYIFILIIKTFRELSSIDIAFVIGFIMMLIHLYFISGIVNVFCWFMIGVVLAILKGKS